MQFAYYSTSCCFRIFYLYSIISKRLFMHANVDGSCKKLIIKANHLRREHDTLPIHSKKTLHVTPIYKVDAVWRH